MQNLHGCFLVVYNEISPHERIKNTDQGGCLLSSVTNDVIQFYNDLILSIDADTYPIWNATIQSGSENFRFYIDSFFPTGATNGTMPSGNTTDYLFRTYGALSISAIKFLYPIPEWQQVDDATIYFNILYDYWALNMFLIFGGLIIMLMRTCILAVKVRDRTITRDLGIILLFMFFVGWGLFIGGAIIG